MAESEIRSLQDMQHINIVKFYHAEWGLRRVDFFMEFCRGGTLDDLISRKNGYNV